MCSTMNLGREVWNITMCHHVCRLGVPAGSIVCASTVDISDRVAMNTDMPHDGSVPGYDSKRVKLEHM